MILKGVYELKILAARPQNTCFIQYFTIFYMPVQSAIQPVNKNIWKNICCIFFSSERLKICFESRGISSLSKYSRADSESLGEVICGTSVVFLRLLSW